ncbi:hypothetical protein [Rossellomorea sp. BNER]|uniref:hypothetical protein n=1 Tax=Rossellomorea sp. BNER TaxID=2962031 RepID=UPI003AF28B8B|nr:hypothetical protein [Rossellomorea sp. BNER]
MSNILTNSEGMPYPQHEKTDGTFAKTGENNPLPSKDADVKVELELVKAELQEIKTLLNSYLG